MSFEVSVVFKGADNGQSNFTLIMTRDAGIDKRAYINAVKHSLKAHEIRCSQIHAEVGYGEVRYKWTLATKNEKFLDGINSAQRLALILRNAKAPVFADVRPTGMDMAA